MADIDEAFDEGEAKDGGMMSGMAFPALVALWFAALFGVGCFFLPPVLFDAVFGGNAPFGPHTRIVVAVAAAGIGLLMGLFIAQRVRTDEGGDAVPVAPVPRRKSDKRDARAPLDVRAALGLSREEDEAEDDEDSDTSDAYELRDEHEPDDLTEEAPFDPAEVKAPIDDPHFASAWSDSDAARAEDEDTHFAERESDLRALHNRSRSEAEYDVSGDWDEERPAPPPPPAPSRYNPFADKLPADDGKPDRASFEDHAPRMAEPQVPEPVERSEPESRPVRSPVSAPPPPPAWPEPREEEPALKELGVAELVERLARALQGQSGEHPEVRIEPARSGDHRHESALAPISPPDTEVDRALRGALDRLSRLDDVA